MLSERCAVYSTKYHVREARTEKKNDETTHTLQGARSILGSFAKLRKATVSFVTSLSLSGPSAWNNSATTGRIFMKFDILVFFENLSSKFKYQ